MNIRQLTDPGNVLSVIYPHIAALRPLKGEPVLWHLRLVRYYVPAYLVCGESGTLTEAYRAFCEDRTGLPPRRRDAPSNWKRAALDWGWRVRAQRAAEEIGKRYVEQAGGGDLQTVVQTLLGRDIFLELRLHIRTDKRRRVIRLGTVNLGPRKG